MFVLFCFTVAIVLFEIGHNIVKMATQLFQTVSDGLLELLHQCRYLFYIPNPYDTMFPDLNVPRYVTNVS